MQNNIDAQQADKLQPVHPKARRAKRVLIPGVNDLTTTHPEVAALWNEELNEDLKPNQLLAGSNKKVWWKCDKGHSWQATVLSRVQLKSGCPYCSGREALPGENDLETRYPEIAAWWDEERNGDLTPRQLLPSSNKKVWWKCKKGHSWQTNVFSVVVHGNRCPYCAGKKVIPGENDLATRYPEVLALWDSEHNKISPSEVMSKSNKEVWWKCDKGHAWKAAVYAVTYNGNRCPYCAGKKVIPGENDLATRYPEVAAQWDREHNDLSPSEVMPASKKKYWWRCKEGHQWQASVCSRTMLTSGCPYCSGHRKISGKTDLATRYPEVSALWAYDRNEMEISSAAPSSREYVWWKCEKGHYWRAQIRSVVTGKGHCPTCRQTEQKRSSI